MHKIFEKFGSVRGVQAAGLEALQEVLGPKTGESVFEYFRAHGGEAPVENAETLPVLENVDELDDVQLLEDEEGGEEEEEGEEDIDDGLEGA